FKTRIGVYRLKPNSCGRADICAESKRVGDTEVAKRRRTKTECIRLQGAVVIRDDDLGNVTVIYNVRPCANQLAEVCGLFRAGQRISEDGNEGHQCECAQESHKVLFPL